MAKVLLNAIIVSGVLLALPVLAQEPAEVPLGLSSKVLIAEGWTQTGADTWELERGTRRTILATSPEASKNLLPFLIEELDRVAARYEIAGSEEDLHAMDHLSALIAEVERPSLQEKKAAAPPCEIWRSYAWGEVGPDTGDPTATASSFVGLLFGNCAVGAYASAEALAFNFFGQSQSDSEVCSQNTTAWASCYKTVSVNVTIPSATCYSRAVAWASYQGSTIWSADESDLYTCP